jgi:poly(beta-D-mannuronate) lyase
VVSQVVTGFARDGNPARADCVVNGLDAWARAGALTAVAKNHTGKSMRKWALATLSSSWLQLKFSPAHPLDRQQQKAADVEHWLSHLADLTVADWRDLPLKRVNNHSYWAAWAIMATALSPTDAISLTSRWRCTAPPQTRWIARVSYPMNCAASSAPFPITTMPFSRW